jgi:hypothetical protein
MTAKQKQPPIGAQKNPGSNSPVSPAAGTQHNYGEWLALAALVVAMTAQMWIGIRQLSVTADEIVHLYAGYRYLQCGDSRLDPEHPPLVKIVAGLPLTALHVNDPNPGGCGLPTDMESAYRSGHDFLFANPESMLTTARMSASIFAILLLITTYFFARSLFGAPVALIAGTWVAFEPNLLGHGSLVTTDVPGAFGFVLAVYALWRYLKRPTFLHFLALGLGIGIALVTKYSTVMLVGMLPILIVGNGLLGENSPGRRVLSNMGALALAMLVAAVVIWATYGFRYASGPNEAQASPTAAQGILANIMSGMEGTQLLPQAYLAGLQDLTLDSGVGRRAFLLGTNYLGGRWYYFPVAVSIKLTAALIVASLLSLFASRFWRSHLRELQFLLLPILLYMCVSASSGMNLGVRYVLPIFPFLIVFAAAGVWGIPGARKSIIAAVVALLLAHAFSSLHAFPNYISYGNELWGGSGNVYKYLADSNADWGQALKTAHAYVERTKPASCLMIPPYRNVNKDYDVPCPDVVAEIDRGASVSPYTGTLIVSSSVVDGIIFRSGGARAMRIFRGVEPTAKLGGSALLVYEGTFDLGPIISYQYIQRILTGRIRNAQEVVETAKAAAELDPKNSDAWSVICETSARFGDKEAAQSACNAAYQTVDENPYSTENDKASILRFMASNGMARPPHAAARGSR